MGHKKTGILFVPQEAFFFKVEDLPSGLGEADLRSYAQTLVENNSPLPIDLLRWGFCASGGKILIFAAAADRLLKNKKLTQLMGMAPRALPFVAMLWDAKFKDGWNVVSRNVDSGVVEYAAIKVKDGKWADVFALTKRAEVSSEEALKMLARLAGAEAFDFSYKFSLKKLRFAKYEVFAKAEGGGSVSVGHGGFKFFSRADVRDPVSLRSAYKTIFNNRLAISLFAGACAAVCILLLWNVTFLYQNSVVSGLRSSLDEIAPEAAKVSQMGSEVLFLKGISSRQMNNVLLLAKINRSRPDGISFSKSSATSPKNIEIRGRSSSVALIMDFEKALKSRPDVKVVTMQSSGATAGGTSWTLNVEFKD